MSNYYLNCMIAALWIWVAGRCRGYLWTRRSLSFKGFIPHMGVALRSGFRRLAVVEYIPPKRLSVKNFVLLFRGTWRVWHINVISVRRFKTKREAVLSVGNTPIVTKYSVLQSKH